MRSLKYYQRIRKFGIFARGQAMGALLKSQSRIILAFIMMVAIVMAIAMAIVIAMLIVIIMAIIMIMMI